MRSIASGDGPNLNFHEYDRAEPSHEVQDLLHEIDRDPTNIFWG